MIADQVQDRMWRRLEGLAVGGAALYLAYMLDPDWPWWVWPVIFLAPDLSFFGYLFGPATGAITYNLCHIYGFGLGIAALGAAGWGADTATPWLVAAGLVVLGHAGIDRALGFGLKRRAGFQDTDLGQVGRKG
ncbi:DUF4260 family protein [Thioclava sp. GXIMD2076]|uniref:DUF4260 family protein n=1 Tax=Thioclava sp. GXIMD2076 TaxID=3131931 RepID=UPI0030D59966